MLVLKAVPVRHNLLTKCHTAKKVLIIVSLCQLGSQGSLVPLSILGGVKWSKKASVSLSNLISCHLYSGKNGTRIIPKNCDAQIHEIK